MVVEIDRAVIDAVNSTTFPSLARTLQDPRVKVVVADALEWLANFKGNEGAFDAVFMTLLHDQWRKPSRSSRVPRSLDFFRRLHAQLAPHGLLIQDVGSAATPRSVRQFVDLHRATFAATWVLNFVRLPDNLENFVGTGLPLDGYIRRPPRLLAISSRDSLQDPLDVDWDAWASLGLTTEHYHASMHCALFVLPSELQRDLRVPPPLQVVPAAVRPKHFDQFRALWATP